jgi:AraC-like DNA-binding protein
MRISPVEVKQIEDKQSDAVMHGMIQREAFEDLAACVKTFFHVDGSQLEQGDFRGQLEYIAGSGLLIYRENYSHRTHLECELLGKRFGFSIPLQTAGGKFLGEPVDDCRIASSISGEAFDHIMERGFEQIIVLFDHDSLLKTAVQAGLSQSALEALSRGRRNKCLSTNPSDIQNARHHFTMMLDAVRRGDLSLSAGDFEKAIFDSVLPLIDGGEYQIDRHSSAILVRRAIDFFESVGGPVHISNLCAALNASPRTLQLAFQKVMGITPHNFFHKRRLGKARMALINANSRESQVTYIANNLGFSELGRFSVQYRQLFGESPSDTLRRSPKCCVQVPFP